MRCLWSSSRESGTAGMCTGNSRNWRWALLPRGTSRQSPAAFRAARGSFLTATKAKRKFSSRGVQLPPPFCRSSVDPPRRSTSRAHWQARVMMSGAPSMISERAYTDCINPIPGARPWGESPCRKIRYANEPRCAERSYEDSGLGLVRIAPPTGKRANDGNDAARAQTAIG
jgi:hypothetical protein